MTKPAVAFAALAALTAAGCRTEGGDAAPSSAEAPAAAPASEERQPLPRPEVSNMPTRPYDEREPTPR